MSAPLRAGLCFVILAALVGLAACGGDNKGGGSISNEWPTFSGSITRTGFYAGETTITKDNVGQLAVKWKFPTEGPVPASPVVATVDVPGEGDARIVVVGSYDGNVYAIRASDGSELWRFAVKPQPGVGYGLISSTATIAEVSGKQQVFVAGGETVYALDAATGERLWEFDAGSGCTTCDAKTERNEITSTPAVVPEHDLILFGMDTNDNVPGKGGFFAISANDGRLRWYFDPMTAATCHPDADDNVRRFDGFHSAEELGLPADFFATREGCDFDRTSTACGNAWSPVSVDMQREVAYFTVGNCDVDDDPSTPKPPPPMPPYNDAIVALRLDGTPVWTWRPRDIDTEDLDFGAGPNLFVATIGGEEREVVGVGGKDGTYYLLDRDGENELTGKIEPYWQKNVVRGTGEGGITGTAAVMDGTIFIAAAVAGDTPVWALSASDGSVVWSQPKGASFYGGVSAVPGVVFMSGVDGQLHAYDAATGEILAGRIIEGLGFSQAAIAGGEVYVGAGFGTVNERASGLAAIPAAVWAFRIQGEEGCTNATPAASPPGP